MTPLRPLVIRRFKRPIWTHWPRIPSYLSGVLPRHRSAFRPGYPCSPVSILQGPAATTTTQTAPTTERDFMAVSRPRAIRAAAWGKCTTCGTYMALWDLSPAIPRRRSRLRETSTCAISGKNIPGCLTITACAARCIIHLRFPSCLRRITPHNGLGIAVWTLSSTVRRIGPCFYSPPSSIPIRLTARPRRGKSCTGRTRPPLSARLRRTWRLFQI